MLPQGQAIYDNYMRACRIYGLLSLGRSFSPLPDLRKRHDLVTSGMYSECRVAFLGCKQSRALPVVALELNKIKASCLCPLGAK